MKVTIIPFGDEIAPVNKEYWFTMDLDQIPRSQDEFTLEDDPSTIRELTGSTEFYGIVDSVNYIYNTKGQTIDTQLTIVINEEIEEQILQNHKNK